MEEKIIDFIKRGIERGFHIEYLKDVLIRKGHDKLMVNIAAHKATTGSSAVPEPMVTRTRREPKDNRTFVIGLLIFLVVSLGVLCIFFAFGDCSCPDQVECASFDTKATYETIDKITLVSNEITEKQRVIDEQLSMIQNLDATVEEKEILLIEQLGELKEINVKIREEREWTRKLLLDLLESVFSK